MPVKRESDQRINVITNYERILVMLRDYIEVLGMV